MSKILLINGPNLNMLGIRNTTMYGSMSLKDINQDIQNTADKEGISIDFFQSNIEGEIIDCIHKS
ncbi:MAG TPA: type II 3-dehydroquinate dehydratase, partial [Methanosarcinales archaeon]|nr:type II 3-dehydroquinate dehydratase [Methanosarcinales archaeon]